jgi:hypothetical protein
MRNLLIVSLLTPPCCFAQGAQIGKTRERKACSRDASHFCKKLLGDDMAVLKCLQQNRQRLVRVVRKSFKATASEGISLSGGKRKRELGSTFVR